MRCAPKPEIVTTSSGLEDVCSRLAASGGFAFDTEFVGEDSYQPQLCLIQAATDSLCALIDPLAGLDASPFWELVTDPAIQVVVHAGSEDLTLCWTRTGKPAANVIDLQIAAGFIGLGYPTGLTRLARLTVGAKLHKSQTLTDWRERPLSQEQIDYAAEDVIHLPAMHSFIQRRLAELGREEWAAQDCAEACRAATTVATGEQKLRRLRGAGSLKPKELAIVDALLEEREKLAQEYNRPSRTVLRDHLLVELARRGWTDPRRIQTLRGLNLRVTAIRRLAAAIEKAKQLPPDQAPNIPSREDSTGEEVLLSLLGAVLRDHCHRHDLAHTLLAGKQDLRVLVRAYTRSKPQEAPIQLRTGWRQAAIGDLLDRVLSGQCSVRVSGPQNKHRLSLE